MLYQIGSSFHIVYIQTYIYTDRQTDRQTQGFAWGTYLRNLICQNVWFATLFQQLQMSLREKKNSETHFLKKVLCVTLITCM